jgi:hypothetical protein
MDYDYLIYSDKFTVNPYYIISAIAGNFEHLTGVYSFIPAAEFYSRCIERTLEEADFDIDGKDKPAKDVTRLQLGLFNCHMYAPKLF